MRWNLFKSLTAAILGAASALAWAGPGDPIRLPGTFGGGAVPAWEVEVELVSNQGAFDHLLDFAGHGVDPVSNLIDPGVANPLFAATDTPDPSSNVVGYAISNLGDRRSLGIFASGTELVFRLVNYEREINGGTPIGDVLYTGSFGATVNPDTPRADGRSYASVAFSEQVGGGLFVVGFDDLIGFQQDYSNLVFNVFATPVPEPGTLTVALSGLGLIGWMAGRRRAGGSARQV